ncbi:MAG: cytochrome c [Deltaproteobacteria bacterium]|nr:cytochrome c [Deltaproteobacteria bacterium]
MNEQHGNGDSPRNTSPLIKSLVALAVLLVAGAATWWFVGRTATTTSEPAAVADAGVEPTFDTKVARGEYLFQHKGCFACHGQRGAGGVVNTNYVLDTVPRLDEMADRLMLFEPEDAQKAIELIQAGTDLGSFDQANEPFPGYPRFVAQYGVVKQLILNGAHAAKKDPNGVEPPLQMPTWRGILSDEDVDSIIAYLISIYDWDDTGDTTASAE